MIQCVSGLVFMSGAFLLTQRRFDNDASPGLWEAPAGKVEEGESHFLALRREFDEELGVDVTVGRPLGDWEFHPPTTNRSVHVYLYQCTLKHGEPWPRERQPAVGWFSEEGVMDLVRRKITVPSLREFCEHGGLETLR
jgi:8-oxo-dGTP diphosphatase